MLEGFNSPEGQELSEKQKELLENLQRRNDETEEEAYQRIVQQVGETGIALFYALELGIPIDFHSEAPQETEVEAFKTAGLTELEITTFLLPKYLEVYKKGNEFQPGDKFTLTQMYEAISRVANITGWRKDEIANLPAQEQEKFVQSAIAEINEIAKREIGKEIISENYEPQYKFANELVSYGNKSRVIGTMFRMETNTRDLHITTRVHKAVKEGKSPFLIFGDSHTYKINPALEYLAKHTKHTN
ncbi:MAG: hypothetical protein NZM26_01280 [Patescibacteria group bacterium]|nr:hypothetical protein [Patescibacteria group bacterium]